MANRGVVVYTEPKDVARGDAILATDTSYLLSVLLVTMNERDSINRIMNNPDNYGTPLQQLSGIIDPAKENEMSTVRASIGVDVPIYASYVNTVIKYTNEMVRTCGGASSQLTIITCTYPYQDTIIKVEAEVVVLDQQKVNPVTGVGIVDASGNAVMIPGFRNPIPVLDANGNPTYYTVTKKQIFKEGPEIETPDTSLSERLCGNISISCPNRVKQYGWKSESSSEDLGYVWVCSSTQRQAVVVVPGSISGDAVPSVNKGDIIYASTFIAIATNLRLISQALDSYKDWWNPNGSCSRTCQVSCQKPCMLSCQSCYGGTCHNQNCGGWS
jgi:hypothetical protein